jgi:hypothetical protein
VNIVGWRGLLCAVVVLLPALVRAEPGPVVPCGAPALPAAGAPDAKPAVGVWRNDGGQGVWEPPACTGWAGNGYRMLIAVSGRFRSADGVEPLIGRFAAISHMTAVRYWSVSAERWQPLVTEAYAQSGPQARPARADFSVEELRAGRDLFFSETGSLTSGAVTYRLRVRDASPERLVLTIENVGTMRRLFIPLFEPGELQTVYVLEQEAGEVWRYFQLTRTLPGASALTEGHDASYVNRGLALFRHFTGLSDDGAPTGGGWR